MIGMESKQMLEIFIKSKGELGNGTMNLEACWDGCQDIVEQHVGIDIYIKFLISVEGQSNREELSNESATFSTRVVHKNFLDETAGSEEI